jgi:hypothetical protein
MKKYLISLSVFALSLGLFVTSSQAQDAPAVEAPKDAVVILYRQNDDGGKEYSVTMQNNTLVKLESGNYASFRFQPGKHYLMADPKSDQVFQLEIEAGKTYYVRAMPGDRVGINTKKPALKLTEVQEFEAVKPRMADVSPKSTGEGAQASR